MNELSKLIPVFITVRSTSSRLPSKCFLPFGDFCVLEHVVHRARHYGLDPIICTTRTPDDDAIVELAERCEALCFRGPSANKLLRWSKCCSEYGINAFHSVDADDPFFCGDEVRRSFDLLRKGVDMVAPSPSSSNGGATVGYSLTAEIVHRASAGTDEKLDTEMMWHYVERLTDFKKIVLSNPEKHVVTARMTLDYHEDYILLEAVRLILGNYATRAQVAWLFRNNSDLEKINAFRTTQWAANQKKKSL